MPDDRPVIYLGLEDNEQRLQRRVFEIFGNNIPKNLKLLAGLKEGTEIPKGKEALEWLRKFCAKDRQPQCVFIDTVANILPDHKHTDYAETTREWGNLRKLAHELKTVLYAVHHNRKASDTDFDPLENILGSQGIAGTVETAHVLQKVPNSSNVKVHFTGKDIEKQDVVYKWENPGFSILGDETTSRLGTVQEAALNIIKQHPRCQNRLIDDKLSKTKGEVSRAVGRLAELRLVQKVNSRLIATPVNPVNSANLYNDEQL